MLTIPLPTEVAASFEQRTRIEGVDYALRFTHNSRTDSWTLDVSALGSTADENEPIVTGMKVFIGNDLLRYANHPTLTPPGKLLALSSDGLRRAPTRDELGTRVQLYYLEEGETLDG
jgi:hypothetical protein